jgi:hypothetical protein
MISSEMATLRGQLASLKSSIIAIFIASGLVLAYILLIRSKMVAAARMRLSNEHTAAS